MCETCEKLKLLCRDLDCCCSCKNNGNKTKCKECTESGDEFKYWEFNDELMA